MWGDCYRRIEHLCSCTCLKHNKRNDQNPQSPDAGRVHRDLQGRCPSEHRHGVRGSEHKDPLSRVTIDDQLTADQRVQPWELLEKHRLVFAGPGNEGRTTTVTHRIPLLDETPITRSRKVSTAWRAEVNRGVKRMQEQHIIRPSSSAYAVPKKERVAPAMH